MSIRRGKPKNLKNKSKHLSLGDQAIMTVDELIELVTPLLSSVTDNSQIFLDELELECKLLEYDFISFLKHLVIQPLISSQAPAFRNKDMINDGVSTVRIPSNLNAIPSTMKKFKLKFHLLIIQYDTTTCIQSIIDNMNFAGVSIRDGYFNKNNLDDYARPLLSKANHIYFSKMTFGEKFNLPEHYHKYHFTKCVWKTSINGLPVTINFDNSKDSKLPLKNHKKCIVGGDTK